MRTIILSILCLTVSFAYAQLPLVDIYYEEAGGFLWEQDGSLYWEPRSCDEFLELTVEFTEEGNYFIDGLGDNGSFLNESSEKLLIRVEEKKTPFIMDVFSEDNFLFHINFQPSLVELSEVSLDYSDSLTVCETFGNPCIQVMYDIDDSFINLCTINDDGVFLYHNNTSVPQNDLSNVSSETGDSIYVIRVEGQSTNDTYCNVIQTKDTLISNAVYIKKKINPARDNFISIKEGNDSLCPGDTTFLSVNEGVNNAGFRWYRDFQTFNSRPGIEYETVFPGDYFVASNPTFQGGECPAISNIITIGQYVDCKAFVTGKVRRTGTSDILQYVTLEADNGEITVSKKDGTYGFYFSPDEPLTNITVVDGRYIPASKNLPDTRAFPLYTNQNLSTSPAYPTNLAVYLTSSMPTAGKQAVFDVSIVNHGSTGQTTDVEIELDEHISYLETFPPFSLPSSVNGTDLVWNDVEVDAGEIKRLQFLVMVKEAPDSIFVSSANLTLNDFNNSDNLYFHEDSTFQNYPDHQKMLILEGHSTFAAYDSTEFIYTLRFQNNSNDTLSSVLFSDKLDEQFERNSFLFIGSSHPVNFRFVGDSLNFILTESLPDSSAGLASSLSWIKFSVESEDGLAVGTELSNISFVDTDDFIFESNEVIKAMGELVTSSGVTFLDKKDIVAYPNPAIDRIYFNASGMLSIHDLMGKKVFEKAIRPDEAVEVQNLNTGLYIYRIEGKDMHQGMFLKK